MPQTKAPAGGVVVRGVFYPGGKWIPAAELERSNYDQYLHVQAQRAKKYKRADGSLDVDGVLSGRESEAPVKQQKAGKPRKYAEGEPSVDKELMDFQRRFPGYNPHAPRHGQAPLPQFTPQAVPPQPLSSEISRGTNRSAQYPIFQQIGRQGKRRRSRQGYKLPSVLGIPLDMPPEHVQEHLNGLYKILGDFEQERAQGLLPHHMGPRDILQTRAALWDPILEGEDEFSQRGDSPYYWEKAYTPEVGKISPRQLLRLQNQWEQASPRQYTEEQLRQITGRRYNAVAERDLSRELAPDLYPLLSRQIGGWRHPHNEHRHIGGILTRTQDALGYLGHELHPQATEIGNAAYAPFASPAWQLQHGIAPHEEAAREAIRAIQAYGFPATPEQLLNLWRQAKARRDQIYQ